MEQELRAKARLRQKLKGLWPLSETGSLNSLIMGAFPITVGGFARIKSLELGRAEK